jgi:hypothetical protein
MSSPAPFFLFATKKRSSIFTYRGLQPQQKRQLGLAVKRQKLLCLHHAFAISINNIRNRHSAYIRFRQGYILTLLSVPQSIQKASISARKYKQLRKKKRKSTISREKKKKKRKKKGTHLCHRRSDSLRGSK